MALHSILHRPFLAAAAYISLGTCIATAQNSGEEASPSDNAAVQLQLSDQQQGNAGSGADASSSSRQSAGAQAGASASQNDSVTQDSAAQDSLAPAQPRPFPRSSQLGGQNGFNSLARSSIYASPFAVAVGAGGGQSRAALSQYFTSASHRALLETPEMFGDFRRPGSAILFTQGFHYSNDDSDDVRHSDFPSAASFSGLRVSENNVALPQDRVWFSYNHLHNSFMQPGGDLSLDRFTLGLEKTFLGGSASLEVRLPIAGSIDPPGTFGGSTSFAGGSFGNLSLIAKRVLTADDSRVVAVGVAIETPTGSRSHAIDFSNGQAEVTVSPSAVYLTPYLGTLRKIDDIYFINSFFQIDIPTSGERMLVSLGGGPTQEFFINQPVWMQIDVGGGVWLTTPERNRVGLALTTELHIATALTPSDGFVVDPVSLGANVFVNQDGSIRNILNSTTGIHAQLNNEWSVRTAISVPMLNERIFDTEVMVQVNRNY